MLRRFGLNIFSISAMAALLLFSACSSKEDDKWTEADHAAALHYFNSLRDNKEASRIVRQAGNTFSPKQKAQVRALTASSLDEARTVSDELLDKVHPQLKNHFRDEFQVALELALANLDNPNYEAAQKASVLFSNYADWFAAHQSEIHMPH